MANIKFKRAILAVLLVMCTMFCFIGSASMASAQADQTGQQDDILTYFLNNRELAWLIDECDYVDGDHTYENGGYFWQLYKAGDLEGMKRIVNIAKRYDALLTRKKKFSNSTSGLDYLAELRYEHSSSIDGVRARLLVSTDYASYDLSGIKTLIVNTLELKLDKIEAKAEIEKEFRKLTAANVNYPDGAANQIEGFYDNQAAIEDGYGLALINSHREAAIEAIDAAEGAQEVADAKAACIDVMRQTPRNVIEHIYDCYEDVMAYERGAVEQEPVNELSQDAQGKCQNKVNAFLEGASEDVKKAYAGEIDNLKTYFEEHPVTDGSVESNNLSTLRSEDGSIVVTAYIKSSFELGGTANVEAKVFPKKATVKINAYSRNASADSRLAGEAINAENSGLTIGYLISINVYDRSKPFNFERVNKNTKGGVIYVVKIDLEKYYKNLSSTSNNGFLGEMLGGFLGGVWGSEENKIEDIKNADKLLSQKNQTGSLCYSYDDGKVLANKSQLNGGILMFETSALGSFALSAGGTENILSNPIFWLIAVAALIVLIIVISIVLKYACYAVRFDSNGGTPVKKVRARKGEHFVMPENPTREGYTFAGWFEDVDLTKRFLATSILRRKGLKAYAKWNLELTPERINSYYESLRHALASHACLTQDVAIPEGQTKIFAVLTKEDRSLRLYLALDPATLVAEGFEVKSVADNPECAQTPALFVINTRSDFAVAQKLVARLITACSLKEIEDQSTAAEGEVKYVLEVGAPKHEEQPAEQAEVTDEQLNAYFAKIRQAASGYALYEANEKAEDGKMLVKLYKREDAVYCYLALEAAAYELEAVEGEGFADTPALSKVNCDEELARVLELVDVMMREHGLEKVEEEVEAKPYEGKSFGYRIHYIEESEEAEAPAEEPAEEPAEAPVEEVAEEPAEEAAAPAEEPVEEVATEEPAEEAAEEPAEEVVEAEEPVEQPIEE